VQAHNRPAGSVTSSPATTLNHTLPADAS
jgi:hypothetical protein